MDIHTHTHTVSLPHVPYIYIYICADAAVQSVDPCNIVLYLHSISHTSCNKYTYMHTDTHCIFTWGSIYNIHKFFKYTYIPVLAQYLEIHIRALFGLVYLWTKGQKRIQGITCENDHFFPTWYLIYIQLPGYIHPYTYIHTVSLPEDPYICNTNIYTDISG